MALIAGTQFTCFTSTKVQIRTPEELLSRPNGPDSEGYRGIPVRDSMRDIRVRDRRSHTIVA